MPDFANVAIVVDMTFGELRAHAAWIDSFGLVDTPIALHVENGEVADIKGGAMAYWLKAAF